MKQEPTDKSLIKKMLLGHCAYAPSDLNRHNCTGRYQRFFFGKTKQGRKTVEGIVYIDEYVECTCLCHVPEDERPKPKARRAPRKKAVKKTGKKSK